MFNPNKFRKYLVPIAMLVMALVAGSAYAATTIGTNISTGGTLAVTGATTLTGLLNANGGIAVDTTNFTVDGTTGALHTAGDFDVATNKFTVASASGNTDIAGTLGVTGATTLAGLSATTGSFSSTLGVTGATTLSSTLAVTGDTTLTGLLNANGGASVVGALTLGPATSHLISSQTTAPTAGGTCTTPVVTVGSTDTKGNVTTASCTAGQTVIVNFNTAYAAAPTCVVSAINAAGATPGTTYNAYATASTTALTITSPDAATTGGSWNYICVQ